MYVNDLLELFSDDDVQILMYADDTVIYFAHKNVNAACMKVEVALRTISKWCEINKLTINVNKTKHMLVPQRKVDSNNPVNIIMLGDVPCKSAFDRFER